jgi:hypothetical protein
VLAGDIETAREKTGGALAALEGEKA